MANTANRGYPKPVDENLISDDVYALMNAFDMIDADVASILLSLSGKASSVHTHAISEIVGLATALDGKSPVGHTHSLDNLTDVSGATAAANGYVLQKVGGIWVPVSAATLFGAHTHAISDIVNLQTALDGKLSEASLASVALKTAPVDADSFPLSDSAASNSLKRASWANIKTTLKTYFDGLYSTTASGIQPGTVLEFAGSVAPTGYYFCYGQAVSRTGDAALFAAIGTAYGAGDGSTTFNLPDRRDRAAIGKGDMGGTEAARMGVTLTGTRASTSTGVITGLSSTTGLCIGMQAFGTGIGAGAVIASIDSATQVTLSVNSTATGSGSIRFALIDTNTLGATGGAAVHTLTTAQMPSHTHPGNGSTNRNTTAGGSDQVLLKNGTANALNPAVNATGGDQAHPNVQPSIVMNFIIKR